MLFSLLVAFICLSICAANLSWQASPSPSKSNRQSLIFDPKSGVNEPRRVVSDFSNVSSRKGFIRKVYSIFIVQMITTISATAVTMKNLELQNFFFDHIKPLFTTAFAGVFMSSMALQWAPKLRYKAPINFILLGIHTLCNSFFLAIFSTLLDPRMVCLVLAAATIYSLNPNSRDLTVLGNVLLAALTSVSTGVLLSYLFQMPLQDNIISGLLAVIFAGFLAFDIQKIIGGKKRKHVYNEKEYILAALTLYDDVVALFMEILKILHRNESSKKNNRNSYM